MSPKRPRDPNQLAKLIVDISIGEAEKQPPPRPKNPAAVKLGRLGGLKGGKARANNLTPKQLSAIGKKGADIRWRIAPFLNRFSPAAPDALPTESGIFVVSCRTE